MNANVRPKSLKMRALDLKRIELYALEKEQNSSVWVLNRTNPAGNINLSVSDGMGNQIAVRVPIAQVPIDLTTQATKQSLLANPQFRTLIAKQVIVLIASDEAQNFFKDPEAAAEMRRIYAVGEVAEIGSLEDSSSGAANAIAESSGELNPFAMNIALQGKDMDEDEAIRELRNREDELTKADFQYIAQNSSQEKVKAWAAERAI